MTSPTEPEIVATIARLVADLHGLDAPADLSPGTRFFADLGLASIDAVVLGEALQRHFRRPLPFADLLADLGRRPDRDITLGELAAFLRPHL